MARLTTLETEIDFEDENGEFTRHFPISIEIDYTIRFEWEITNISHGNCSEFERGQIDHFIGGDAQDFIRQHLEDIA